MKLERATAKDLNVTMSIIQDAQVLLASQNIDQWQNGYPTKQIILDDIKNKESYILKSEQSEPLATTMFSIRGEPTYTKILGQWKTNSSTKYGVIHRMAVAKNHRGKGLAKFIFSSCEKWLMQQQIPSMRIDTHKDNFAMQQLLRILDYSYCGIIHLPSGDQRLAFEKKLFS